MSSNADSKSTSNSLPSVMNIYRARLARMNPEGVLRSCREAVKMLRTLRTAHKEKREAELRYSVGDYKPDDADTLCAAIDLLDAAGYFDIDGALHTAEQPEGASSDLRERILDEVEDPDDCEHGHPSCAKCLYERREGLLREAVDALAGKEETQGASFSDLHDEIAEQIAQAEMFTPGLLSEDDYRQFPVYRQAFDLAATRIVALLERREKQSEDAATVQHICSQTTVHAAEATNAPKPEDAATVDVGLVDAWVDGWLECMNEHSIDHGFTDAEEHELAAKRARESLGSLVPKQAKDDSDPNAHLCGGCKHWYSGVACPDCVPDEMGQANADAYTLEEAQRNVVRQLLMDAYRHPQVTNIEEAYAIVDGVTAHLGKQIADFHAAVNADIARRHAEA